MTWTADQLARIGEAEELHLAPRRTDGIEADVSFAEADPDAQTAIDAAYHAKYDRYGPTIVSHVTGPGAHAVTVRLLPAQEERTSP
jgi:hypothetical protein